jgi:hypothetical protein
MMMLIKGTSRDLSGDDCCAYVSHGLSYGLYHGLVIIECIDV